MELSDKKGIQQIVETLAALGLNKIVICPGSRNAPLVISFNRHPAFTCTSIRDERSAAFFALGMSMETGMPVAVVSTSGSAVLNFAPAISEAYYQHVPLIVITADRLKEWTHQGDGQTINQTEVYRNYINKSYELRGDADNKDDLWYNNRCINEGWNIAVTKDKGPVHFNIPLSEPLYRVAEVQTSAPRVFREVQLKQTLPLDVFDRLQDEFRNAQKVMILAGQLPVCSELKDEIVRISKLDNVIVLTESISNLHDEHFVENIDRCITPMNDYELEELMPDLLITIGGAIISKRIKSALRKFRPLHHWYIDPYHGFMDTYQCLTMAIPMEPYEFFKEFNIMLKHPKSDYRLKWEGYNFRYDVLHNKFKENCAYSDFKVFDHIIRQFPKDTCLHISNSSPIRYVQLFENRHISETWCNRGTSGIDGCTSTAVGAAFVAGFKNFVLITGDVAFNYDINALWNESQVNNLKIIVINNGGGGIFRIISGPDKVDEMENYFETAMNSDAKRIAERYEWQYMQAEDSITLKQSLTEFFSNNSNRCILEIFTNAEDNPRVLNQYWDYLKNNGYE